MNTRQLSYIIKVAETRSFSEAAGQLMISQPSLSQYISKIENEIGLQIFERTVPLKITYAGEIYLASAKKMLKEEAELEERIADLKGGLSGKLKIGSGYLNAISLLPRIVSDFQTRYPNVQIEIYEETEPKLKQMLDDGVLDLVVATSQFNTPSYEKILLSTEEYLIAIPKFFGAIGLEEPDEQEELDFERKIKIIDFDKLENIPLVRLQPNTYMRELIDSLYDNNHIKPRSTVECTTAMAAYSMAKRGVGATLIPYSLYKSDFSYNINYYSIPDMKKKRKVSIIYNKSRYLNNVSDEFIRIAQESYADPQEV